jgi:pimeloyl-ACP methyl ester carboxylesterase
LADHRLLMPDLVDFGFSARPSSRGRLHTVVGQAETMLALVEELGISNLSVVGAGLGGSVAAQMASLEPGVVDRLVLIAPEILGPEPTWQSMLYRLPSVGDALTFTFMGAGARADASYSAGCGNGGYCPDAETRAARQAAAMVPGTTDALTAMFATPPASTLPDSLGTITVPTLIVWGDDDTVTPLTQGAGRVKLGSCRWGRSPTPSRRPRSHRRLDLGLPQLVSRPGAGEGHPDLRPAPIPIPNWGLDGSGTD